MASWDALISQLMSAENDVRKTAEASYNAMAASAPADVVAQLTTQICNGGDPTSRNMAAVLLRKQLDSVWRYLPPATQTGVKAGLLFALTQEQELPVRNKIGHVVAEAARLGAGDGAQQWPELLPKIFELAASPSPAVRASALKTFRSIATTAGGGAVAPHAGTLVGVLPTLLADADPAVSVAALESFCAVVENLTGAARDQYTALVPALVKVLERSFAAGEEFARDVLKALIAVLDSSPHFFRAHLEAICTPMLQIIREANLEEETRKLAMEFLVVLAESAPSTMRKIPGLIQAVLALALSFLVTDQDIDDIEDWAREDEDHSYGDDEMMKVGIESCDRLAKAVGGKHFLPVFEAQVLPLFSSTEWKARRGAILAYSLVAEGVRRSLAVKIREVASMIANFVRDPHPLVRHSAVRALGQLSLDFGEEALLNSDGTEASAEIAGSVLKDSHGAAARARASASQKFKTIQDVAADIVIPALVESLSSSNAAAPRIRGLAALGLVNFVRGDGEIIEDAVVKDADPLMRSLISAMMELPADFFVSKGSVLSAIASVAGTLEEKFEPYYAAVAPSLKQLILTYGATATVEQATLRNKALECLSIAFHSVGKVKTGVDAAEALNFIVHTIGAGFPDSDADSFDTFCRALILIGETLGADFAPYLAVVIPLIAQKASQEIANSITGVLDESEVAAHDAQSGRIQVASFEVKGEGTRVVSLDSVALNEKSVAIETLGLLASSLGTCVPAFHQFVDPLLGVAMTAAVDRFPNIKQHAIDMLTYLLMAAISDTSGDGNHGQRVLDQIFPFLIDRVLKERSSLETAQAVNVEICEAAKIAYESADADFCPMDAPKSPGAYRRVVVRLEFVAPLCAALKSAMTLIDRRREKAANDLRENPDADEEAVEHLQEQLESDDQMLSNFVDTVGYCIKMHGAAVMPILMGDIVTSPSSSEPGLGPDMLRWLSDKTEFQIPRRVSALCLADDIIEFAGEAAASNAFPAAFPHFIECAGSSNSLLRHPAVYGLGLCAQFCGSVFDPHVPATLTLLHGVITHKNSRDEENLSGTENAVSSVIKIARFRAAATDANACMAMALQFLPFLQDSIEARLVHGWLVEGFVNMDPLWIGPGGSRGQAVVAALGAGLIANEKRIENGIDAGDEDGDEGDGDPLFTEASLNTLRTRAPVLLAGPAGGAVRAVIAKLKPSQQKALAKYGVV